MLYLVFQDGGQSQLVRFGLAAMYSFLQLCFNNLNLNSIIFQTNVRSVWYNSSLTVKQKETFPVGALYLVFQDGGQTQLVRFGLAAMYSFLQLCFNNLNLNSIIFQTNVRSVWYNSSLTVKQKETFPVGALYLVFQDGGQTQLVRFGLAAMYSFLQLCLNNLNLHSIIFQTNVRLVWYNSSLTVKEKETFPMGDLCGFPRWRPKSTCSFRASR